MPVKKCGDGARASADARQERADDRDIRGRADGNRRRLCTRLKGADVDRGLAVAIPVDESGLAIKIRARKKRLPIESRIDARRTTGEVKVAHRRRNEDRIDRPVAVFAFGFAAPDRASDGASCHHPIFLCVRSAREPLLRTGHQRLL
jgi:hypothetical protein